MLVFSAMIDFHEFHLKVFPQLLERGRCESAVVAARELSPLCVRQLNTDNAYSYRPSAYTIDIIAGTEAGHCIEIDRYLWSELASHESEVEEFLCQGQLCKWTGDLSVIKAWLPLLHSFYTSG
jgi:hypothetical protein